MHSTQSHGNGSVLRHGVCIYLQSRLGPPHKFTNIRIDLDEPSAFPQLLHLCPSLSSLTIYTLFIAIEALEPFTHNQLQSLCIVSNDIYDDETEHLNLFGALSLPNLRTLEARGIYSWHHEEFKEFLTRSKCPLENLTFGFEVLITDEQRAEYTALIPSLKEVLVVSCYGLAN